MSQLSSPRVGRYAGADQLKTIFLIAAGELDDKSREMPS